MPVVDAEQGRFFRVVQDTPKIISKAADSMNAVSSPKCEDLQQKIRELEERVAEWSRESLFPDSALLALEHMEKQCRLIVCDAAGKIIHASESFFTLLGYSRDEVIGKHLNMFSLDEQGSYETIYGEHITVESDFFSNTSSSYARFLKQGRICNLKNYYKTNDGRLVPVRQSLMLVRNSSSMVAGVLCSVDVESRTCDSQHDRVREDSAGDELSAPPADRVGAGPEAYDESVTTREEFDLLQTKIRDRMGFILKKIPTGLRSLVARRMFAYWTGSKLMRFNPHICWDPEHVSPGGERLLRPLHIVVVCPEGLAAYEKAFFGMPFSHSIIGLHKTGSAGTFLGSNDAISRYLNDMNLKTALRHDYEIVIDRQDDGDEKIERLTHTTLDVRNETLFIVFDEQYGLYTHLVRTKFPNHQIVTVIKGACMNKNDHKTFFSAPEDHLAGDSYLVPRRDYTNIGFYYGKTFFAADCSAFYDDTEALAESGYIFGITGLFSSLGVDYSGPVWGSRGGAEGAARAARALFGVRGAQTQEELARAIRWADGEE